jgi:hypothetical protein
VEEENSAAVLVMPLLRINASKQRVTGRVFSTMIPMVYSVNQDHESTHSLVASTSHVMAFVSGALCLLFRESLPPCCGVCVDPHDTDQRLFLIVEGSDYSVD